MVQKQSRTFFASREVDFLLHFKCNLIASAFLPASLRRLAPLHHKLRENRFRRDEKLFEWNYWRCNCENSKFTYFLPRSTSRASKRSEIFRIFRLSLEQNKKISLRILISLEWWLNWKLNSRLLSHRTSRIN